MTFTKVRIRFQKAGDLRFLSHHDLMRVFERMMRRAALPFRTTEGFHPKPKMAFASALGLGIVGRQEVVEIEFAETISPEEIEHGLAAQAPPGMEILSVKAADPGRTAQVASSTYHVRLDPARHPRLADRVAELLAKEECWIERQRPHRRRINLRPYLLSLTLNPDSLTMLLRVTPNGSVRPEEVLEALELGGLAAEGSVVERIGLELQDEAEAQENLRNQVSSRNLVS